MARVKLIDVAQAAGVHPGTASRAHQLVTPDLADAAVSVDVDRAPSYDARWSDHAPLLAAYDL